jgi:FkbM family methyltransferase
MKRSGLKRAAKSALYTLARKLPWPGRHVVFEALLDEFGRYEVFRELGAKLGIDSLSVNGSNGLVYGSINDIGLLLRYATAGAWARETVTLFGQFFKARGGGTFLDIGANIGLMLIPIARNPTIQCYGFEPEPRNFSYLKQNIAANCPHGNVSVNQLALFDRKGPVELELSPGNSGDHRIRTTGANGPLMEATWETISVAADRLDSVVRLETLKLPLAVKIDTQGSEPSIVAGGRRVLAAAELISVEFCPYVMRRVGGDAEAELRFLGANFREGSIAKGDTETPLQWRPIETVVDELRHHLMNREIGDQYFDVVAKK